MTEINWTTLLESMQADLLAGTWKTKSYQIGSRRRELVTLDEFLQLLAYVEKKAGLQAGTISGRTYARPIRRR